MKSLLTPWLKSLLLFLILQAFADGGTAEAAEVRGTQGSSSTEMILIPLEDEDSRNLNNRVAPSGNNAPGASPSPSMDLGGD